MRIFAVFAMSFAMAGTAASSVGDPLQADNLTPVIMQLDAGFFDAYNRCDLKRLSVYLANDVEFYHDQSGVTVGKRDALDSVDASTCGKITRSIVPGTVEVYPIHAYGALETGVHRFFRVADAAGQPIDEAKFLMLWRNTGGTWVLARVISYDHHAVP